jgi:hypothetical protein
MQSSGALALEQGPAPLPARLSQAMAYPLATWQTPSFGAVLFLAHLREPDGSFHPNIWNGTYERSARDWTARQGWHGSGRWGGADESPGSADRLGGWAVSRGGWSGYGPEPGLPAVTVWGWYSAGVAQIWLVQEGGTERGAATGHFGGWIIGSQRNEPYRVEAHDEAGNLVGFIDGPDWVSPTNPLFEVVTPQGADQAHASGRMQVRRIERHQATVIVEWLITLEPDPEAELAEELAQKDQGAEGSVELEDLAERLNEIDRIRKSVFFAPIEMTDDLGTFYQNKGGHVSRTGSTATWRNEFQPAIPDAASRLTISRGELTFHIPLS